MHFFKKPVSHDEIVAGALGKPGSATHGQMQDAYLGFIVVKPLPYTPVGRTCLRTYDSDGGRRNFPVVRKYEVHLLGFEFTVDSLAFQEQDTVAAACATSALWSVFQGTATLFHHHVPSPVEVTRIATEQFPGLRRAFPNKGLNPIQIAAAVKRVGLEPETIAAGSQETFKATAYAYLCAKIPLILMASLYDVSDPEDPRPYRDGVEAGHAVAITGYSLGSRAGQPHPLAPWTFLRSSRIDKLYVHDDQIGPFARLGFGGPAWNYAAAGGSCADFTMTSSWKGRSGAAGFVCFAPETLVIPLYHKIRISLDAVLRQVFAHAHDLDALRQTGILPPAAPIEWDVRLLNGADLKSDIRVHGLSRGLGEDVLRTLLERAMPRFVWRATAMVGTDPIIDFIYDATDIEQSDYLLNALVYDQQLRSAVLAE